MRTRSSTRSGSWRNKGAVFNENGKYRETRGKPLVFCVESAAPEGVFAESVITESFIEKRRSGDRQDVRDAQLHGKVTKI